MGKLKESIKNLGKAVNGVEPNGYYITDIVKDLGKTFTGNEVNGVYLTDILDNMANNYNASKGFIELVPYMATDVLGKATTDLQEGVEVVNASIKGTLKYVTGYTGFSGDPAEQSGNFLTVYTPLKAGVTVTMELIGGTTGVKTLDDGIIVLRITNKDTQSLKLVATDGVNSVTRIFDFKELTLTPAPVPPTPPTPSDLTPYTTDDVINSDDKIYFDTSVDATAILNALTYEPVDEGVSQCILISTTVGQDVQPILTAQKLGNIYILELNKNTNITPIDPTATQIIYASEAMEGVPAGWQNLDGDSGSDYDWSVLSADTSCIITVSNEEGWNGVIVGK